MNETVLQTYQQCHCGYECAAISLPARVLSVEGCTVRQIFES